MKVQAVKEINTARGVIPQGMIFSIPDDLLEKLRGRVQPFPAINFKCRACGSTKFRQGYVARICIVCQVPEYELHREHKKHLKQP